jgi:hypothetical protein
MRTTDATEPVTPAQKWSPWIMATEDGPDSGEASAAASTDAGAGLGTPVDKARIAAVLAEIMEKPDARLVLTEAGFPRASMPTMDGQPMRTWWGLVLEEVGNGVLPLLDGTDPFVRIVEVSLKRYPRNPELLALLRALRGTPDPTSPARPADGPASRRWPRLPRSRRGRWLVGLATVGVAALAVTAVLLAPTTLSPSPADTVHIVSPTNGQHVGRTTTVEVQLSAFDLKSTGTVLVLSLCYLRIDNTCYPQQALPTDARTAVVTDVALGGGGSSTGVTSAWVLRVDRLTDAGWETIESNKAERVARDQRDHMLEWSQNGTPLNLYPPRPLDTVTVESSG